MSGYKETCAEIYEKTYAAYIEKFEKTKNKKHAHQEQKDVFAQKEAIKETIIQSMQAYPNIEPALIWKAIYEIHVHRKSGITDAKTIASVISADQSWKKSSGHAFEEMVKLLGNLPLKQHNIEIVLQKDLNTLIKANELSNEPRDLSWLKEQVKTSVFDLYALLKKGEKYYCFGCIQSKTSIRDRVTRDREPSIQAMASFFWSCIIVLDGDFLKNKKFTSMVTGGTSEHPKNGWHGMYVFSNKHVADRIYPLQIDFTTFTSHAIKAANFWLTQRQWFTEEWRAN